MLLDYIPNKDWFEDKDDLSAIETPFVAQFDERLAEKWSGVALNLLGMYIGIY